MRRLVQITGWLLLLVIAALSVVPPSFRPITILPHDMEHAAIYFPLGFAFGLGYPRHFLSSLLALSTYALAIELAQLWIPGRHARALDFIVDVLSLGVGLGIGVLLARQTTNSR